MLWGGALLRIGYTEKDIDIATGRREETAPCLCRCRLRQLRHEEGGDTND